MQKKSKKMQKNLRISKKSSTFAPAFESRALVAREKRSLGAIEKKQCSLEDY